MSETRWVLHVDLDQFIAAVEVLRRPELRGLPVVVGGAGDPTQRAVVATATYEAREFGVKSGMPLRTAAKRCPEAVFLPSDPPAYEAVSARVMALLRELRDPGSPAGMDSLVVVEVLGWDEAFLEVHTSDPEGMAREIQQAIFEQEELTCSVGIADNKLRAKLATGFGKPKGMFRLTEENWYPVMAKLPTDALWGIGPKTSKKLAEMGIQTVADLALSDPHDLAARFGPTMGPWFRKLSRGADNSAVEGTPYVQRSHSRETTFQENLTDWDVVREEIVKLAARVTEDVVAEGRPAVRVGVKLRFAPFQTHTASVPLAEPTSDTEAITAGARAALAKFEPGRAIRLLGVKAEFPPVD